MTLPARAQTRNSARISIRAGARRTPHRAATACVIAALTFLGAACASTPRPTEDLARADALVRNAQDEGAARYAPAPMQRATQQLDQARIDVNRRRYTEARRAAQKAQVEAELASAEARRINAQTTVHELQRGNEALRQELQP
jgi:hypothetical protein